MGIKGKRNEKKQSYFPAVSRRNRVEVRLYQVVYRLVEGNVFSHIDGAVIGRDVNLKEGDFSRCPQCANTKNTTRKSGTRFTRDI